MVGPFGWVDPEESLSFFVFSFLKVTETWMRKKMPDGEAPEEMWMRDTCHVRHVTLRCTQATS